LFFFVDDYPSFLASLHKWKLCSNYLSYSLIPWIASHFFYKKLLEIDLKL
jgi:hypothetical protein